ncbi:hypothetical protein [Tateyamaria sp. SN6-1]|uniref:hypothetical protein n=1 Tax=Tateyamaria sp. SN6-1 TaxID=3092148 RepID=UPI0039F552B0
MVGFDRHVGTHNRGRTQKGIVPFTIAGISNNVRETGLVCAEAFASHMMAHQRMAAMADAHVAKTLERLQGFPATL